MTVNPNWDLTPEQRRDAEMRRGQEVIVKLLLAEKFDPDYKPPTPTHVVTDEMRAYHTRLHADNKNREDK